MTAGRMNIQNFEGMNTSVISIKIKSAILAEF